MATFTLFNDLGLVIGSFLMPYWGALLGYGHALLLLCGFTTLGWAVLVAHLANVLRPARVKPWVSSS